MASPTSQQSMFKCCICLDSFTDPVSTPCGHNFCKVCINTHWDSADTIQCPLCQHSFKKRPQLSINVSFRDLLEQMHSQIRDSPEEKTETQDVLCDVCAGEKKVMAAKSCLHCEESFCCEHVKPHLEDAELTTHELLDPVSRLKERVCKRHKAPLELVCRHDLTCVCLLCIKSNHQNHQCVPLKSRLRKKKAQVDQELAELQQVIQDRKTMLIKVDRAGEFSEKNTRTDAADILRIFAQLKSVVNTNELRLVTAVTMLHRKAEIRSESIKEKLQEEITDLEERKYKLDRLSQAEDDLRLLQSLSPSEPPDTQDWSEISAYSDSAVGTVRCGLYGLLNELHSKVTDESKGAVAKVDVTLDCDTANLVLVVSNDGKQVRNGGVPQNLPDNPERFTPLLGVLGKEGYSSGAFYFEVQLEGKAAWDIGVALETVNRKGETDACLRNGFAVLMLRDGKTLTARDQPPVEITLPQVLTKVGVFVDHEEGEVCFYDVKNKAHIYSFTRCSFPKKKLHPYFNTCTHRESNNSPMVITPVS